MFNLRFRSYLFNVGDIQINMWAHHSPIKSSEVSLLCHFPIERHIATFSGCLTTNTCVFLEVISSTTLKDLLSFSFEYFYGQLYLLLNLQVVVLCIFHFLFYINVFHICKHAMKRFCHCFFFFFIDMVFRRILQLMK